jgi:hypothetical protein
LAPPPHHQCCPLGPPLELLNHQQRYVRHCSPASSPTRTRTATFLLLSFPLLWLFKAPVSRDRAGGGRPLFISWRLMLTCSTEPAGFWINLPHERRREGGDPNAAAWVIHGHLAAGSVRRVKLSVGVAALFFS